MASPCCSAVLSPTKLSALLVIMVGGSVGAGVYWVMASRLRLEALAILTTGVSERLARRRAG